MASRFTQESFRIAVQFACIFTLWTTYRMFKGTVPWDFRLHVFFMNQFPPSPWVSHSVKFVRKCAEIFASQGAPSVSMTPAATGINDTGTAGAIDTRGKFTTGVVDTRLSLKPMANFPPMFVILMMHHDLQISPWIFEQNWNDTCVFFRGLGEDDSWKKPKAKNLMTLSLSSVLLLQRLERNSVDLWIKEGNS